MSTPGSDTAYLEFKMAQSLYRKAVAALTVDERREVQRVAARQRGIEARVLGTPQATGVCVPDATLDAALAEIRSRYRDEVEFLADLAANGLGLAALEAALRRELAVEAVLEKVSADAPPVSDVDAELFYRLHIDRFLQPERRRVRHILVTINDKFAESGRDAARVRIEAIAARLAKEPDRFTEQALKHSECPTALQGGLLGEYRRGQLFAALDAALFQLKEGETSAVLESSMGFHILRCEAILPPGAVPFQQALPRIRSLLADQRSRNLQRAWLRRVLQEGQPQPQAATSDTA